VIGVRADEEAYVQTKSSNNFSHSAYSNETLDFLMIQFCRDERLAITDVIDAKARR